MKFSFENVLEVAAGVLIGMIAMKVIEGTGVLDKLTGGAE